MKNFRLKNLTTGNIFTLTQSTITIGRGAFNFVRLESDSLSSQHASLHIENGRAIIEDLNSTNGTLINNMPVKQPTELMHGDVITLGNEKLMLIDSENQDDATVFSLHAGTTTAVPTSKIAELNAGKLTAEETAQVVTDVLKKVFASMPASAQTSTGVLATLSKTAVDEIFELNTASSQSTTWNVGRDDSCPVTINNPTVSVSHASIRFEDGVWVIKDNGSTNGTKVNGKRVVESECKNGDIISFGKLNCVFGVAEEAVVENN
jgi:pSer/pThr/pTyr-binding forkhead associated (FHA) protein